MRSEPWGELRVQVVGELAQNKFFQTGERIKSAGHFLACLSF